MYRKKNRITRKISWWISRNMKCKSLNICMFWEACLYIQLHHYVLFSLTPIRHKDSFIPSNPLLQRDLISRNPIQSFLSIYNRNPFLSPFSLFVVFSCKLFGKATEIRLLLVSVGIAFPEWQANFLLFSS